MSIYWFLCHIKDWWKTWGHLGYIKKHRPTCDTAVAETHSLPMMQQLNICYVQAETRVRQSATLLHPQHPALHHSLTSLTKIMTFSRSINIIILVKPIILSEKIEFNESYYPFHVQSENFTRYPSPGLVFIHNSNSVYCSGFCIFRRLRPGCTRSFGPVISLQVLQLQLIYFNCQLPNSCRPTPFIMVDYLITLITTLLRLHQSTNIKQDLLDCKNIIYLEWKHLWVSFL